MRKPRQDQSRLDGILSRHARGATTSAQEDDVNAERLAAWLEGRLSQPEAEALEAHLAGSDELRALLAAAAADRGRAEQPHPAPARLKRALLERWSRRDAGDFIRLIYSAGQRLMRQVSVEGSLLPLQPLPVRSPERAHTYGVALGEVDIEVATDRRKDGRYEIWLRINPRHAEGRRCKWELWNEVELLEVQPSSTGEALFVGVPEGRCKCILYLNEVERGMLEIALEG